MSFLFTNKAITFLDTSLSAVSGTIVLASGEGALFPSPTGGDQFALTIENRLTGAFEIVYCTNRTGDQLTVTRARDGTSAQSWAANDIVSLRATAAVYNSYSAYEARISSNEADITQAENDIAQLQIDVAAVQAQILQNIYPVGSLYMSTLATNPNTTMGFGTWAAYAQGRALVGVGNNGESSWTGAQEQGSETHTLVEAELPAHSHLNTGQVVNIGAAGSHAHTFNKPNLASSVTPGTSPGGASGSIGSSTSTAGSHVHTAWFNGFYSDNTGSDTEHNNIQPSIGVYVWQRTA